MNVPFQFRYQTFLINDIILEDMDLTVDVANDNIIILNSCWSYLGIVLISWFPSFFYRSKGYNLNILFCYWSTNQKLKGKEQDFIDLLGDECFLPVFIIKQIFFFDKKYFEWVFGWFINYYGCFLDGLLGDLFAGNMEILKGASFVVVRIENSLNKVAFLVYG